MRCRDANAQWPGATAVSVLNRVDHAGDWVDILLDQLTDPAPTPPDEERDPLEVRMGEEGQSALDEQARLVVASERFDPSVRESLTEFFHKTLARHAEERFTSAESMHRAWLKALEAQEQAPAKRVAEGAHQAAAGDVEELTDAQLAAIAPNTRIDALPLPPRARNALDRAGLVKAEDLRALADNRLSAIRGIGRLVAQEILTFRARWVEATHAAVSKPKPFFADYQGADLSVDTVAIQPALAIRDQMRAKNIQRDDVIYRADLEDPTGSE